VIRNVRASLGKRPRIQIATISAGKYTKNTPRIILSMANVDFIHEGQRPELDAEIGWAFSSWNGRVNIVTLPIEIVASCGTKEDQNE
jgi:hypothetical protein